MTRGTAHLAVLEGTDTYYLEKLGGTRSVHALSKVGGQATPDVYRVGQTAVGHVSARDDLLDAVLADRLQRLTTHSTLDHATLRRELDTIREHELASEHEEALIGFKSFAVPIYDSGHSVIAALSLTVPVRPLRRRGARSGRCAWRRRASPASTRSSRCAETASSAPPRSALYR